MPYPATIPVPPSASIASTTWAATEAPALARVHLVGIGGAGMSGIARILLARGARVSGSDAKDSRGLATLRLQGATVAIGHSPGHVEAAAPLDAVITSAAVRADNPEIRCAARLGVPVLPRAAALAALMAGRRAVAVAGTHGKTTTTSMLAVVLSHCGADPSFAIGGDLNEPGSNAHHGSGDVFVAEADESDESFLLLSPQVAVVTNVEADHLDHYADLAAVETAFRRFVERVQPAGLLIACADDAGALAVAAHARVRGLAVQTYGENPAADLRMLDLRLAGSASTFGVRWQGEDLGSVRLGVPGRHNALDAAGAIAAALALGQSFGCVVEALGGFPGARRRFELKGQADGVRVFDSYAHHPTEVAVDLAAARLVAAQGRVLAVFQPHRYSRTAIFGAELGTALGAADEVVVMDVYPAGEDPLTGVSGATVAAAVPLPAERVAFEPSWTAVAGELARRARPGDLVLTIGAGDVTQVGPEVLAALAAVSAAGSSAPPPE